jgi:hypothetical protein
MLISLLYFFESLSLLLLCLPLEEPFLGVELGIINGLSFNVTWDVLYIPLALLALLPEQPVDVLLVACSQVTAIRNRIPLS